jgi:MFS family permease
LYDAPLGARKRRARMPPPDQSTPAARFARVTVANFCFFLTFASFFLLPLHVRALGGSERTIGLVMGTGGLAGLASIAAVGPLLDRFGRRRFLLGGLGTMAVASAAFLGVDRIGPLLFALRGVQGVAFAAAYNAAATLAADYAPADRRAAWLGLFGVSTLATHALAPSLGEVLVAHAGFSALFGVAAAWSVVGLAVAWPVPAEAPPGVPGAPARLHVGGALGAAIVTIACCGVAFGTVLTYVPTFVRDAHLGRVATFFLSYTGAAILTRVGAGGLGDSLGRARVVAPALALLAASLVVLAWAPSAPWLAAAGLLFGTAQGFVYPTLNAFAIDQAAPGQIGRAQTLYNGAFNVGVTGGAILLGPVVEALGYRRTFVCAAGMAVIALLVFQRATRVPHAAGRWRSARGVR